MTKQIYKAVIVGLGDVAWKYKPAGYQPDFALTHVDAYRKRSDISIAGSCSVSKDDREGFGLQYKVPVFESVEELLKEIEPDIVSICSPSEFHYQHILQCLNAGVPMIWLEKPPATDVSGVESLISKEQDSESTILVNYQRRYCECYGRLKDLYSNQVLGKAEFINLTYSQGLSLNGSHIIDVLFYVMGDNIQLSVENVLPSDGKDDIAFSLRTPDGLRILVSGMSLPYHCLDITLTCEEGRASILYGGLKTMIEKKVAHEVFAGFYQLKEEKDNILGPGGIGGSMEEALNNLIVSYKHKKEPVSSLRTGYNTSVVINNVKEAAKAMGKSVV